MEKSSQNCATAAQLFLCNEYIVFTKGGTVALQLAIPTFYFVKCTNIIKGCVVKSTRRNEECSSYVSFSHPLSANSRVLVPSKNIQRSQWFGLRIKQVFPGAVSFQNWKGHHDRCGYVLFQEANILSAGGFWFHAPE